MPCCRLPYCRLSSHRPRPSRPSRSQALYSFPDPGRRPRGNRAPEKPAARPPPPPRGLEGAALGCAATFRARRGPALRIGTGETVALALELLDLTLALGLLKASQM